MFRWLSRKLLYYLSKRESQVQTYALGLNSWIDKNSDRHFLFLDYDKKNMSDVLVDCKELSEFWRLSDYEIYSTNKGFHVFYWYDNNIPYGRLKMIIDYSRCDPMFKHLRNRFLYATIRASGKYKANDILYQGRFSGVRSATSVERELGNLKRQEYLSLKNLHIFSDEVLK